MNNESSQKAGGFLNRLCRFSLWGFAITLGLAPILMWEVPVMTVALMLVFGVTYLCAITVREVKHLKERNWRFSLRGLFIAISVVAIVLGAIMYAARE